VSDIPHRRRIARREGRDLEPHHRKRISRPPSSAVIGTITHYFKGPHVAVVKLTDGELAVGDEIHVIGHTTDFTERVGSMEVEHKKIEVAKAGDEVAVQVVERARPHDQVFKIP
jgi:putative protease